MPALLLTIMKNLILGYCYNYPFEVIEPFIASFLNVRKLNPNLELVFFAKNMDKVFELVCQRKGIHVFNSELYNHLNYPEDNKRWIIAQEFLNNNQHVYDKVLLTDIRDVIFQGDPFALLNDPVVFASMEPNIIRNCYFNNMWISNMYGESMANLLGDCTITCGGTVIGATNAMLAHLDMFTHQIREHHVPPGGVGYDQAIHNYIAHYIKPGHIVFDLDNKFVQTLVHTNPNSISIQDELIFVDGKYSPIIHQYDRKPVTDQFITSCGKFRII